jgi:hypothetical protein
MVAHTSRWLMVQICNLKFVWSKFQVQVSHKQKNTWIAHIKQINTKLLKGDLGWFHMKAYCMMSISNQEH